jgi:hypothetical protein
MARGATSGLAPQSQPVARAPRLTAHRAVGGFRAWAEDAGRRASSPSTLLSFVASDGASRELNTRQHAHIFR